ncbi:MAG TPA: CotH kinase family protein, partial [Bacteroidota bacterium]|nr:CotH kinase family protein [Bacteroidota bacterium]
MMKTVIVFLLFVIEFGFAQLPEYKITMSPPDYELLYTRDIFSDSLLPAVFEYQGSSWNDARIRFKGRSTRFFPKKSYRVRFTTLNQFQNARQINFNSMYTDKSFIREKLAWDLFNDMNLMTPKAHHCALIMNNEWKGVYLFVDKIDRYFLQRNGRIVSPMYEVDDYWSLGDLTIQPDSLLKLYYPKEVGDVTDYSDLRALIEAINITPDSTFADVISNLFDMNSVYKWFAGNVLMMMGDSYNKNYFLYRDTTRLTQQWSIIPWDYDLSFGRSGDLAFPYPASLLNDGFAYSFQPLSGPNNVLKDRFWNTPSLREQLRLRVDTLLQTVYTEERMHARIDSLSALITIDVYRDPQKWGTYQDFSDHVEALKYFVTARKNYLLNTFINLPSGEYDLVTLPITEKGVPYHFVTFDGRQIATMWFTDFQSLDSILVRTYPDSAPPAGPNVNEGRFVRRWLKITPFPSNATFTAKLQFMYNDYQTVGREVGSGVQDERQLRSYYHDGAAWNMVASRVNPFANIVTMDSITQEQCGSGKYFALFLPDYTQTWYRRLLTNWERWYDVQFADARNGFVIGDHGTVLRTQDSGSTWQQSQIGINFPFRKLAIRDSANLFAVGDFGSLYNSTNAGITWSKIDLGTRKNLRSITFANSNVGWVVGEGG